MRTRTMSRAGLYLMIAGLLSACHPASGMHAREPNDVSGLGPLGGMVGCQGVVPNCCGLASSDAGRKLQAFLRATLALDQAVAANATYLRDTCQLMGTKLGMAAPELAGGTKPVCQAVSARLRAELQGSLRPGAQLRIASQPPMCNLNLNAAARAAGRCEGKAAGHVAVRCNGTCTGTCNGICHGRCAGTAGGGQCAGTCEGSCHGACSGSCQGRADVDADVSCKAEAEVQAGIEAKCTEPKLRVNYDARVAVDKKRARRAVAAIRAGVPKLLQARAKAIGPIMGAYLAWSHAAQQLAHSADHLARSFRDQALCVGGQISAAAGMLSAMQASIQVQVEVSVEVSAAAGVSAG